MSDLTKLRTILQKWTACELTLEDAKHQLRECLLADDSPPRGVPSLSPFRRNLARLLGHFDPSPLADQEMASIHPDTHTVSSAAKVLDQNGNVIGALIRFRRR
jgi:hypothetical protein